MPDRRLIPRPLQIQRRGRLPPPGQPRTPPASADNATGVAAFIRTAADSPASADVATGQFGAVRTAADFIVSSDSAGRVCVLSRTAVDSSLVTEVVTAVKVSPGTFVYGPPNVAALGVFMGGLTHGGVFIGGAQKAAKESP